LGDDVVVMRIHLASSVRRRRRRRSRSGSRNRIKIKVNQHQSNIKVKGGGQECPPHTLISNCHRGPRRRCGL